jgi:hypothetical protein
MLLVWMFIGKHETWHVNVGHSVMNNFNVTSEAWSLFCFIWVCASILINFPLMHFLVYNKVLCFVLFCFVLEVLKKCFPLKFLCMLIKSNEIWYIVRKQWDFSTILASDILWMRLKALQLFCLFGLVTRISVYNFSSKINTYHIMCTLEGPRFPAFEVPSRKLILNNLDH